MTLHWWMHWFWVTLWFAVITGIPLPSKITNTTTSSPLIHKVEYIDTEAPGPSGESSGIKKDDDLSVSSIPLPSPPPLLAPKSLRENYRVSKSVGIVPSAAVSFRDSLEAGRKIEGDYSRDINRRVSTSNNLTALRSNNDYRVDREANDNNRDTKTAAVLKSSDDQSVTPIEILRNFTASNNPGLDSNRSLSLVRKKESKVTWLITGNGTGLPGENERRKNSTRYNEDDSLAVLPLQEPTPTRFKLVLNRTKFIPSTNLNDEDNHKLSDKSKDVEVRGDPGLLATAASVLQGVTESPRLSRARSAFPGDYQQDEQQEQRLAKTPELNPISNSTNSSAMDIAAVTGSCLATVVLIGTMGSLGFVMYRRRYMNPPQTLNSDKCSNPDSSGYIDDSTIRDNSEEMYSLDNDSFLNSLEAMTIQNYWTDSVKHTKL